MHTQERGISHQKSVATKEECKVHVYTWSYSIFKVHCLSQDFGLYQIVSHTVFSKLLSLVLNIVFYLEILGEMTIFQFPHLEKVSQVHALCVR